MKKWFLENFLPMWAKETVFRDNRLLVKENRQLTEKVRRLESYIEGLQEGIRAGRKIQIVNGGGK